jgi:hypothetical protein
MGDQKPSVGRIVLYSRLDSNGRTEHPAIITNVFSDTTVNVTVFPDVAPMSQSRTSVVYNDTPGNHTWRWPPRV